MHTWMHLLAWVRSWTCHGVAMWHTLWGHARIVWIARGHHLVCSLARAVASQWDGHRESRSGLRKVQPRWARAMVGEQERPTSPRRGMR